ncbi:MAG: AbrB family transcriptional regulator [Spirochaetia bacterium]|nr:AbrB family transcriptional regulator [Spirochaetia bacterium]
MNLLYLLVLHLIGSFGALAVHKTRIPAGKLIGAILAVMIFSSFGLSNTTYPVSLRIFIQILSGLVIGTRFKRDDIQTLHSMIRPVITLIICLLSINVLFAYIMDHTTSLSFMTSFFACAPGGVSDLALVATDFGAVMEQVALLQLFRLISVIIIFPPLIRNMLHITSPKNTQTKANKNEAENKHSLKQYMTTLAAALFGGLIFHMLHIPAGPILGAIICVAIVNLASNAAAYPNILKTLVQIFAGCYIGSRITFTTFLEGQALLLPALILLVQLLFMAFFTAFILHKFCHLDWATALFSATPGGIQEMGLISDELGLQTPKIVLMHTFRILAVLGVLPLIATFLG